jgi:hypothetical protein
MDVTGLAIMVFPLVVQVVLMPILGGIAQSLARLPTMIFMLLTSMQILASMLLSLMAQVKQQLILTI